MNDGPDSHHHHTVRTVSLGTFWRVLRYPFVLLSVLLIPRLMGDTDYGKYAYFMSVFLILDIFTDIGFVQIFGRFVPETKPGTDDPKWKAIFYGSLIYGTLLPLIVIAGLFLVSAVHPLKSFPPSWLWLVSLLLIFNRIEGTLFSFLYGLNQIARFSTKEALRSAFTFLLVYALYWAFGLRGAFVGLILNEVLLTVVGAYWTRAYWLRPWSAVSFRDFRPYLLFGITFYIPAFFFGLMQRSGNIFVQALTRSSEEVAYYDIANQFLLLTSTFLGLLISTLVPALTSLYVRNDQETIQRWQRVVLTYSGVVAFLAFNALIWLGDFVITKALGPEFAPVMGNAVVIAFAFVPMLLAFIGMNYALLAKEPGVYTRGVAAGIGVMTLACLALVPSYGSRGAATATFLGYSALALVFFARYRPQFTEVVRDFEIVLLVAVPLALLPFVPALARHFAVMFVLTSAAYVAVLFALRRLRWSDAQKVLAAFRKKHTTL